jgi:hypothetical protein
LFIAVTQPYRLFGFFMGHPRSFWRWLVVMLGLGLAYVGVQQDEVRVLYASWDKWFHAGVFFGVWFALRWCWASPFWVLSLTCVGLGALAELHQGFMPGFDASWIDWAADVAGVALAHGLAAGLRFKN